MDRPRQVSSTRGRHVSNRACKPNSVVCGHSSRRRVTADTHQQPTRRFRHLLEPPVAYRADTPRGLVLSAIASLPIWSCSVWGLPCLLCYHSSGALLPHLFTLTPAGLAVQARPLGHSGGPPKRGSRGGLFSVALAVYRPLRLHPGRYPAHCPSEFGLSSPGLACLAASSPAATARLVCWILFYRYVIFLSCFRHSRPAFEM